MGGGHSITEFQNYLKASDITVTSSEDITQAVAPSIDLEQEFFNAFGHAIKRVDGELQSGKPTLRWFLARLLHMILNEKQRYRLGQRLFEKERTSQAFVTHD